MSRISSSPFLQAAAQFRLLNQKQLAEAQRLPEASSSDPLPLAKAIQKRGWLTPYQAKQVMIGQGAGLIIGPCIVTNLASEDWLGKLFDAHHPKTQRDVSIRLVRKELVSGSTEIAVQQLQKTVKLRQANVTPVVLAGEAHGTVFTLHPATGKQTLAQKIQQSGPLSEEDFLRYLPVVIRGLLASEEAGLVWPLLLPENVILTKTKKQEMSAQLRDPALAGVAKQIRRHLQQHEPLDVLSYMAPELYDSGAMGDASMQYSVGALSFTLLTGKIPFESDSFKEMKFKQKGGVDRIRRDLSPRLTDILKRLLSDAPGERYPSLSGLLSALPTFGVSNARPQHAGEQLDPVVFADEPVDEETDPVVFVDDLDEVDEPRPARRPRRQRYEEEERRQPRRERRRPGANQSSASLIVGIALGALLLVGGVVGFLILRGGKDDQSVAVNPPPGATAPERVPPKVKPPIRPQPPIPDKPDPEPVFKVPAAPADRPVRKGMGRASLDLKVEANYPRDIAISPNGRWLAVPARAESVFVVDLTNGTQTKLSMKGLPVAVAFRDNETLIIGSHRENLQKLNINTGALSRFAYTGNFLTPRGTYAVQQAPDKFTIIEVDSGETVTTVPGPRPRPMSGLIFATPNEERLVVSHDRTNGWFVDLKQKKILCSGKIFGAPRMFGGALLSDGRSILLSSGPGVIQKSDLILQKGQAHYSAGGGATTRLAVSNDGCLGAAANASSLQLWDLKGREFLGSLPPGEMSFRQISFTPDCRKLVAVGSKGRVRVWDLTQTQGTAPPPTPGKQAVTALLERGTTGVSVMMTKDNRYAVVYGIDSVASVWDLTTRKKVSRVKFGNSILDRVQLTADGQGLMGVDRRDKKIKLWSLTTGKLIRTYASSTSDQRSLLVVSPDGKHFVTVDDRAGTGYPLLVRSILTGAIVAKLGTPRSRALYGVFSADGSILVTSDATGACCWDLKTKQKVSDNLRGVRVSKGTLSADGSRLLCMTRGDRFTIYDPRTGKTIHEHKISARVSALEFTNGDTEVVGWERGTTGKVDPTNPMAGYRTTLYVWDAQTGKLLRKHEKSGYGLYDGSVTRNGKIAVTIGRDKSILLWDLSQR